MLLLRESNILSLTEYRLYSNLAPQINLKPTKMKKNLLSLIVVFACTALASNVSAQTIATVTGTTAGAKLIKPMTLSQTSPLHFGTINVLVGAGGDVILPSNSIVRTFDPGVASGIVNPQPTNAAYNVTGTKNVTYALTLPVTITVTENDGTGATMVISALTARFNGKLDDATTSVLSGTGTDSFKVGGTLTVAPAQVAGIYAGTFNVSVDYN